MVKRRTGAVALKKIGRRDFLATGGGAAAAAAASTIGAPAVHAAKTVKIGFVSPQTGPLAPFGETDRFVLADARATLKNGIKIGSKNLSGGNRRQGFAVEPEPRG